MNYKMVCEAKAPDGMDKCAQARWMIDNLAKCFNMKKEWNQKWGVQHHLNTYSEIKKRIKEYERVANSRECCKKCPDLNKN